MRNEIEFIDDLVLNKGLPSNIEAERSILGAILLNNDICYQAIDLLKREDFFLDTHRRLFDKMISLTERGTPIDLITLSDELKRANEYEQIGGATYISELISGVPRTDTIEPYAKIIKSKARLRQLIKTSRQIAVSCYDEEDDSDTIVEKAEQLIFEIGEDRNIDNAEHVAVIAARLADHFEAKCQDQSKLIGLSTGYKELDERTSGLQVGVSIIAGRPGHSKTASAINISCNVVNDGGSVYYCSPESSKDQIAQRVLASESRIDSLRMREGKMEREEWRRLLDVLGRLSATRFMIDDTFNITPETLLSRARQFKTVNGLDLLVLDYLQLMARNLVDGKRFNNLRMAVQHVSSYLVHISRVLNVPVLALAQLGREIDTRPGHRPVMSDLQESSCLAGDSLVLLADTGERIPISQLINRTNFAVWAINETTLKKERSLVTKVFYNGKDAVWKLRTKLGRVIKATANHQFYTSYGWKRLDELTNGMRIAVPRSNESLSIENNEIKLSEVKLLAHLIGDGCTLPRSTVHYTTNEIELATIVADLATDVFQGYIIPKIKKERTWLQVYFPCVFTPGSLHRNPLAVLLEKRGLYGLRSYEKFVPEIIFHQPTDVIGTFLRHIWCTDGHVGKSQTRPNIFYATSSERLASDIQSLLLRLNVNAKISRVSQSGKGRDQFHVQITSRDDLITFVTRIGAVGSRRLEAIDKIKTYISQPSGGSPNCDTIPHELWNSCVEDRAMDLGVHPASILKTLRGSRTKGNGISRKRASNLAESIQSDSLARLSNSDIFWDRIDRIERCGVEDVFDLTVEKNHNFIVDDIYAHNCLEQDSNLVLFLLREEKYEETEQNRGILKIIFGKHRDGSTSQDIEMCFVERYTRMESLYKE